MYARLPVFTIVLALAMHGRTLAQNDFVNFETPHVSPIAPTPDGSTLLAVNTADARLEIFDLTGSMPVRRGSVPVGLDPVSVRALSNTQAWVVNHVSDSVSIVDLPSRRVIQTLRTLDEPADVVFAGNPLRAFVSCSQVNTIQVFDPANLTAAPQTVAIQGEEPRMLAVSPDGTKVYAAIFESGNRSTILGGGIDITQTTLAYPPNVVSNAAGPYNGVNPPPNSGNAFDPPITLGLPTAPRVGLIVKQNAAGQWVDDNGRNWTNLVSGPQAGLSGRPVGWHLLDHDVAVINTATLSVSYVTRLMNLVMAVGVNPATGEITAVGTDATNEVRFEPKVNGRFLRVNFARTAAGATQPTAIVDLNPHLNYSTSNIPEPQRLLSLGDPRAIVWNAAGTRGYVSGMGSNNLIVIDAGGARAGLTQTIAVGEGPTGIALDEARQRAYVLNKFEGSISVVSTATEQVVGAATFFDPTPAEIYEGRPLLYDTHRTSGLGLVSCGSCHVDARLDRLAWDLGDPSGGMKSLAGSNLGAGITGLKPGQTSPAFADWHPMKGPMTTQTLQAIIGLEPHHWRGDRFGLEEFNPAFVGLLGDDTVLTPAEMQQFEDFLATIHYPPNPFRNQDNTLPTALPLTGHYTTGRFGPAGQPLGVGNAVNGLNLYRSTVRRLDGGVFACVTCHALPTGAGTNSTFAAGAFTPLPPGPNGELHHQLVSVDGFTNRAIKTPQLRNLYEKVGFEATQTANLAGFGFAHDGSVDSIARFVSEPVFTLLSDQEVADMVAFMLSFSGSDLPAGTTNVMLIPPGTPSLDAHAAVGRQITVVDSAAIPPQQFNDLNALVSLAQTGKVGLIVKGRAAGVARGWYYVPATAALQSDRAAESAPWVNVLLGASPGNELTFTVVPKGSEVRAGVDRDSDSHFDRDELDACSDPADAASVPQPGGGLDGDVDGDGDVDDSDLGLVLNEFNCAAGCSADIDGDGDVDDSDLGLLLNNFGIVCPQ